MDLLLFEYICLLPYIFDKQAILCSLCPWTCGASFKPYSPVPGKYCMPMKSCPGRKSGLNLFFLEGLNFEKLLWTHGSLYEIAMIGLVNYPLVLFSSSLEQLYTRSNFYIISQTEAKNEELFFNFVQLYYKTCDILINRISRTSLLYVSLYICTLTLLDQH